jgi:4-aminobutyrate aminotransferase-like enzyme
MAATRWRRSGAAQHRDFAGGKARRSRGRDRRPLPRCAAKPQEPKNVGDIRGKGLLIGVELVKDRSPKEQLDPAQIGGVVDFCRDQGVIVGRAGGGRRFGTTIALCPPPVITRAECDRIVETLGRALQALVID